MEQIDKQALNKKLAEWAGFKTEGAFIYRVEDDKVYSVPKTNFTQSLDACFKWLVPKLERVEIILNEAPSGDVFWNARANNSKVTSEAPALALCLAIEKLIDGEAE